jgi:hypothetical protein
MKYLTLLLIAITTLSCNPSKKLDKLNKKHPELLANFCRDSYPCVITNVDTLISYDTNYIKIERNDYDYNNAFIDTVWLTSSKTQLIDKPVFIASIGEIKTIVKLIKDSAQIKACQLELNSVNKKLIESTATNTKLQNKITGRNSAIMWLIIALLCSIIINVILIKKW